MGTFESETSWPHFHERCLVPDIQYRHQMLDSSGVYTNGHDDKIQIYLDCQQSLYIYIYISVFLHLHMKPQKPRLQGTFFLLYPKWGPGANGASSEQTTKKYLKPVGSYEKTAWPKGRCLWAFPPPKKTTLNPCPHTFPHSDFSSWIWLNSLKLSSHRFVLNLPSPWVSPTAAEHLSKKWVVAPAASSRSLWSYATCEAKTPWNIPWKTQNPNSFMKEFHGIWFHLGVFGEACR